MKSIVEKVAGKLYIIGEYNVLKSGHGALIAPVTLFLEGTINESEETLIKVGSKLLKYADLQKECPYHYLDNTIITIKLFHEYLVTLNLKPRPFIYTIINNLISENNEKYGFGSSGASIVLTIKLLNHFYKTNLSSLQIFKFAVLVQKHLQKFSSGGDLALGVYNEPIYYVRYDEKWLSAQAFSFTLINNAWPLLQIERIYNLPHFVVGWTKESFAPDLINGIDQTFFTAADELVKKYKATYDGAYLNEYQTLLMALNAQKPGLITPKLHLLVNAANELKINAKLSGAGYGDCGIAQIEDPMLITKLATLWQEHDIEMLPVWRKENE